MRRDDDEEEQLAAKLIEGGSEIAGAAVGGALGLIGGPLGVAFGSVGGVLAARTIKRVGAELQERYIGRQHMRMGAAAAVAAEDIGLRLLAGEDPRDDGFFESDASGRTPGEELLEGVLLHAADAYDERKVRHLGWLYSSIAFDPHVTPADANFLLHVADRLTYRQLMALVLFGTEEYEPAVLALDVARGEGDARSGEAVIAELNDLASENLLGLLQDDGRVGSLFGAYGGGDFGSLPLASARPTLLGADLVRLMRLDRIPRDDIADLYAELGGHNVLPPRQG